MLYKYFFLQRKKKNFISIKNDLLRINIMSLEEAKTRKQECTNCGYFVEYEEENEPTIFCVNCGSCDMCPCKCEKTLKLENDFIEASQLALKMIVDKLPNPEDPMIAFFNKLLKKAATCDKNILVPIIHKYIHDYTENSGMELLISLMMVLKD